MSYRRILLFGVILFLCWNLWFTIRIDTPTSHSAVWPLIFGIVVVLMLPEKRLGGELFVKLVEALKGKPKGD